MKEGILYGIQRKRLPTNIISRQLAGLTARGQRTSRPNTPVNVIIGALIINALFDYSGDKMVENLMLDIHF